MVKFINNELILLIVLTVFNLKFQGQVMQFI